MAKSPSPASPLPQLEQNQCVLCEEPMRHCWQFQDDDRGCSLCGKGILTQCVGQGYSNESGAVAGSVRPTPGKDNRLWLYLPPEGEILLCVTWARGIVGRRREMLAPPLDLNLCEAAFAGQLASMSFSWSTLSPGGGQSEKRASVSVARLQPDRLTTLPKGGLGGKLLVATGPLVKDYRAILWPWPALNCAWSERGLADSDGVLQLNQALRVPLEMVVTVKSPVWVIGYVIESPEEGERVELAGLGPAPTPPSHDSVTFPEPILLDPDRPMPFRVAIDTSRWQANKEYRLALTFQLHALPPTRFQYRLKLLQGSRLQFVGGNVRNLPQVQLGQVETIGFALTVRADQGTAGPISIVHWRVQTTPSSKEAGGDWLRVEHPAPGTRLEVKPDEEVSLKLALDTRGLDRDRFDQQALQGDVRLTDSRGREWTCHVQTLAQRPVRMDRAIAFDWGTTNTVAAFCDGREEAISLPLDDAQRDDNPEKFPSDLYFLDLRNPNDPQIEIGHRAENFSRNRPECHVRSLKRTFQFFKHIHVTDEQGIRYTYPVEQLAAIFLHRLVLEAERMSGQEVGELGLTFPTKWPPSVRARLDQVRKDLEKRLQSTHVSVHEPRIDEANAVAIHLLTSSWIEDKKDLREKFYLVAYDFGGGTVDTCVLEVVREHGRADVRTRYIGVGGREDFGGDDATRAVMQMLRKKLTSALEKHEIEINLPGGRKVKARLKEIPLVPYHVSLEGTGADAASRAQRGQANWETLWRIAEAVKSHSAAEEATTGSNVYRRLAEENDKIHCVVLTPGCSPPEEIVTLDKILAGCSEKVIQAISSDLSFPLADAWKEPLEDLHHTVGGREFTVERRVDDTIEELKWQCQRAGVKPSVVVLAGGGSRLELVKKKVLAAFQLASEDYLISNAADAKRRVAYGLANYFDQKLIGDFGEGLARSVDVLHHVLGVCERRDDGKLRPTFAKVLDVGTRIHDNKWHPFEFQAAQLRTGREGRELALFAQLWQEGERLLEIGYFNLESVSEGEPGDESGPVQPLPKGITGRLQGEVRLRGANRIALRVLVNDQRYGLFRLTPKRQGINLEDLLQGPARVAGGRK